MLGFTRPTLLERALGSRNVQRAECQEIAAARGNIRAVIASEPRVSRTCLGHDRLAQAVPELFAEQDVVEPLRSILLRSQHSPQHEELNRFARTLRLTETKSLGAVPLEQALESPARLMWEHD